MVTPKEVSHILHDIASGRLAPTNEVTIGATLTRESTKIFENLGIWDVTKRIQWLSYLDSLLTVNRDVICQTLAEEKHCSEHAALIGEYFPVRMLMRYYLKTAKKVLRDENRSSLFSLNFSSKRAIIRKEPLGVVGIITPFNSPFAIPMGPIVSALLGGNAVLWKPAEETPKTNDLIQAFIIDSFARMSALSSRPFKMLSSGGKEYGEALVKCSQVDKIHFTGSVEAGRAIIKANAEARFTPPTLELGGSNAAIVLEDANLDLAAEVISFGRFSGLNCNSIKRVFAVQLIYQELLKRLKRNLPLAEHEGVHTFLPRERGNFYRFLGKEAERYKQDQKENDSPEIGPYIVAIEHYDASLPILSEETFCPILPVVLVASRAQAIRCANDSKFGLGASVFTQDVKRFREVASQLQCGGVYHNDALTEFAQPQLPFGGTKNSGWGYTHGKEGLLDFVRLKPVVEERKILVTLTRTLGKLFGIQYLDKLQLYPWSQAKMSWLKRLIRAIIKLS